MDDFDVVIYGATSFVGQIICRYLFRRTASLPGFTWAVAGRNQEKLITLAQQFKAENHTSPAVLTADARDEAALSEVCEKTRVIISTVGPYAVYGDTLVKACASTGTDYLDLTGEPQWILKMLEENEDLARQTGARIVHSCGFDSIPSDMGLYYLQQEAKKIWQQPCTAVYMRVKRIRGGASGGTVASLLNVIDQLKKDRQLRKRLASPYALCPREHKFTTRQPAVKKACYDPHSGRWIAPFIMAAINTRIIHRTNALLNNAYSTDFLYEEAMVTGRKYQGALRGWMMTMGIGGLYLAASVPPLKRLLQKYWLPKSGDGPSQRDQDDGFFDIWFYGETQDGNHLTARVTADKDPGYGATAGMISEAAITLATHDTVRQKPGGIYTPASLFESALLNPLIDHAGLTFEIIPQHQIR